MARRKAEVQLQQELETQEEWEEMLAKEGLTVIDIYQEWSGPCAAMISTLRRMKNELGDDLLKFAIAKADTIDALEKYRGRCEPCFLYVASGVLVAVVRGANCPLVLRTMTEQLAQEHKVLDGNAERKEIKDPLLAELDNRDEDEEEEKSDEEEGDRQLHYKGEIINFDDDILEMSEEKQKEVTVAIIKPDAVKAGKTEEIIQEMREAGIEILADEERQLTEEEAREFYAHMQEQEFFEDLIQFMCSGPCHVLCLTKGSTGENIIQEWRHLIGPTSVEEAKESAPNSLRAKFGSGSFMNALHGSDSPDRASRELAFFFPNFHIPTVQGAPKLQRTLALIRPDALRTGKDEILKKIHDAGFQVALEKVVQLTKQQAEEFYKEHQGQDYFEELTSRMSSGPLLALGLAREDAVDSWRSMLGPKDVKQAKEEAPDSLRAQYSVEETEINQLHGSDSPSTAQQELDFFFPMQQTVAAIKPDAYGTKEEIVDKIHEAGFRIAARKETQLTREMAEQFYADQKGTEHFDDLVEHMISGTTHFMVLSREDAVEGWRTMLGPKNPETAKEEAPNTIRALYGKDIRQNAVHGSDNPEAAKNSIQLIFGDLEFNTDGTVKGKEGGSTQQQQAESQPAEVTQESTQQESQEVQQESQEVQQESQETQQESQETQQADAGTEQQQETQQESAAETQQAQESQESAQQESQENQEAVQQETTEENKEYMDENWVEEEALSYSEEEFMEDEPSAESDQKPEDSEQKPEEAESKPEGEVMPSETVQQEAAKPDEAQTDDAKPDGSATDQQEATEQQAGGEQQAASEQQAISEQQETEQQASAQQQQTEQQGSTEQQQTEQQSSAEPQQTEQQSSTEQQQTEQQSSTEQQQTEQQGSAEQLATQQQSSTEQQQTGQQGSTEQQEPNQEAAAQQQSDQDKPALEQTQQDSDKDKPSEQQDELQSSQDKKSEEQTAQ